MKNTLQKWTLFSLLICLYAVSAFTQISLFEDFESGEFPDGWEWINGDGLTPALPEDVSWADSAWIITTSSVFEGNAILSISWYEDMNGNEVGPADDWLITPKVNVPAGGYLKYKAKSATTSGDFPDDYWVLINTGDATLESFEENGEILLQVDDEEYENFRTVELDLSAYVSQDVHIAFRNVTNTNGYGLWLDDIELGGIASTSELATDISDLHVGPNPAIDHTILSFSLNQASEVKVVMYDMQGQLINEMALELLQSGDHSYSVSTNGLSNGTYNLVLVTSGGASTTQFSVSK